MKKFKLTALIIFLVGIAFQSNASSVDSVGFITIEKNKYIVHKVEQNETLYSLLKKYNCSANELLEANSSLKGNNQIYVGQLINFPIKKFDPSSLLNSEKKNEPNDAVKGNHKVERGETLFSISKKYNMSVAELKNLNNLSGNSISLGQILIVEGKADANKTKATKNDTKLYVPNAPLGKPVREFGIATLIPTNSSNNTYLALHRTAPIGSLIKVTNEISGHSVMVKVVGRLPKVGADQDILIKLSPAAYSKLRPKDSKIRTKVDYYLAPDL